MGQGGTQKALPQIVKGLSEKGAEQAVVCLNEAVDPVVVNKFRRLGVEVEIIGKKPLLLCWGIFKLFRWLVLRDFDVAVTMLFFSDVLGLPLSRLAGIKRRISSQRQSNLEYSSLHDFFLKMSLKSADSVVLNSETTKEKIIRYLPKGLPVYVVQNGIDRTSVKPRDVDFKERLVKELLLPEPIPKLMTCVGRLEYNKGIDLILDAMRLLKFQDLHLLLVGDGSERGTLESMARELRLEKRVHFLGFRRDVIEILQEVDLFVQASRYEGMPNSLMEAMMVGCPIVATAVDGALELIREDIDGWLVAPEDADALATAIESALSRPKDALRKGQSARERVYTRFSIDRMVVGWDKLLRGAM